MEKEKEYRTERVSVALTPEMLNGVRQATAELGMTQNAWLGMAVGRAVRAHRLEREVLEKVLREFMGEQMQLELENLELPGGQS